VLFSRSCSIGLNNWAEALPVISRAPNRLQINPRMRIVIPHSAVGQAPA